MGEGGGSEKYILNPPPFFTGIAHCKSNSLLVDENPTVESSKLAEIFTIRKTAAANIIKEEKNICSQHELFHEKSTKRNCCQVPKR